MLLFPLLKIVTWDRAHLYESFYKFENIDIAKATAFDSFPPRSQSENISAIYDNNQSTAWDGFANEHFSNYITIDFQKPENLRKIFMYFGVERPAVNFTVSAHQDGKWVEIDNLENYNKTYYDGYFHTNPSILTDGIRVKFEKSVGGLQKVVDFDAYTAKKQNLATAAFNTIFKQSRSFGAIFFYVIMILSITMISGAMVFQPFEKNFSDSEVPILKFAAGLLFTGLVGVLCFLLPKSLNARLILVLFYIVWIPACLKFGSFKNIINKNSVYLIALLFGVFLITWQFIYDGGASLNLSGQFDQYFENQNYYTTREMPLMYLSDQVVPYGTAKLLMYHEPVKSVAFVNQLGKNSIADRTQLFAFSVIPFLRLFGDNFFIYEAAGLAMMLFIIPACFLLTNLLFGKKSAYLSLFFVTVNYYLLYLMVLTQMKYISVIFLAMFMYFLIKFKRKTQKNSDLITAGIMGSIALLIHNYSIIYIIAGLFYLLPNPTTWRKEKKIIINGFLLPLVIFVIWFVTAKIFSNAWLVNDVTMGAKQLTLMGQVRYALNSRYLNFLEFFVLNPTPGMIWARPSYGYFKMTYVGMTTVALFLPILYGFYREFRKRKAEIVWFFLAVVALDFIFNGVYTLFGIQLYLVGCLPLLFAFASSAILKLNKKSQIHLIIFAVLEWIYVSYFYYHSDITDVLNSNITKFPNQGRWLIAFFVLVIIALFHVILLKVFKYPETDVAIAPKHFKKISSKGSNEDAS